MAHDAYQRNRTSLSFCRIRNSWSSLGHHGRLDRVKKPDSMDGLKRPPPLGAAGRRSQLQPPRDCSTLAKKICRSAVTSCLSHAAQIVGSLRK